MTWPHDIWDTACRIFDEAARGKGTPQDGLAAALLAERQRCAKAAGQYLFPEEIKEAILSGDAP